MAENIEWQVAFTYGIQSLTSGRDSGCLWKGCDKCQVMKSIYVQKFLETTLSPSANYF